MSPVHRVIFALALFQAATWRARMTIPPRAGGVRARVHAKERRQAGFLYKCACLIDEIAQKYSYDDFIEAATAARHRKPRRRPRGPLPRPAENSRGRQAPSAGSGRGDEALQRAALVIEPPRPPARGLRCAAPESVASNLRSFVSATSALRLAFARGHEIEAEIGIFADREVDLGGKDRPACIAHLDRTYEVRRRIEARELIHR